MSVRRKTSVGIYTISDLEEKCIPQDDGCMLWVRGARSKDRGPVLWLPKVRKPVSATQAFEFLKSTPLEPGKRWLPMCGNTMCCANAHRVQMTSSEWMKLTRPTLSLTHRAKIAKAQRARSPYYSDETRTELLTSDESDSEIARRLGISPDVVNKVRRGRAWVAAQAPASSAFNWRPA